MTSVLNLKGPETLAPFFILPSIFWLRQPSRATCDLLKPISVVLKSYLDLSAIYVKHKIIKRFLTTLWRLSYEIIISPSGYRAIRFAR